MRLLLQRETQILLGFVVIYCLTQSTIWTIAYSYETTREERNRRAGEDAKMNN